MGDHLLVRLTLAEAVEFLGIDSKQFDNFFRSAAEFNSLPRSEGRGRLYFDSEELTAWKKDYDSRVFNLGKKEYARCLDFALAMHFRGYVLSDWGTGRQREFGQKVSNWVRGQLGELGLSHFCRERLGVEVELDFEMRKEIVPQDILSIERDGTKRKPRYTIAVKSSKPKSAYLVLGQNEVELPERKSHVYILARVDLPDDHLLSIAPESITELLRSQQHFSLYKDKIPQLRPIPCEIAGFAYIDELEKTNSIPGQEFSGLRYVKQSGKLRRSLKDWNKVFS